MRLLITLDGSSRSPEMIAVSGQTISHAGFRPTSTRCAQKLHFAAVCSSGSMYSASYGHACMHDLQPMQRLWSKSTMPSERLKSAVVGQISMHGASSQWLQRSTVKCRRVFGNSPFSMYFTQVRKTPSGTSCSCLHATVHAWQPMQRRWSMRKPRRIARTLLAPREHGPIGDRASVALASPYDDAREGRASLVDFRGASTGGTRYASPYSRANCTKLVIADVR